MIDLGHSKIIEIEDGLIQILCKDEFMYDVVHIKENHSVIEKISNLRGEPVLVFSLAAKYTGITSDATAYVTTGPHKNFIKAEAFVIHSTTQRLGANFFLRLNKPIVPAAYFNNVKDAKNWLLGFRQTDPKK